MSAIRRLVRDYPSALLLAGQAVVLLGYPFLDATTTGRAVIGVFQLLVVLSAVAAVHRSPALTGVAVVLGVPATVFAVWESVAPDVDWVVLVSAFLHVPLYAFVSYALIRYLYADDVVTRDELYATAAAFTVVAWAFAYAYAAVQVLWPGSFGADRPWFDLLYLSFTTMTNTGLGDFSPALAHARSVVALQEALALFYIGFVVSRLVGLATRRDGRD